MQELNHTYEASSKNASSSPPTTRYIDLHLYQRALHATYCNALRLTATRYNTLQPTKTHCKALQHSTSISIQYLYTPHTATHCHTLPHQTHCYTLQRTTTILQHTATHSIDLMAKVQQLMHVRSNSYMCEATLGVKEVTFVSKS